MTANEILDMLRGILYTTGVFNFQWNVIIMWGVASFFIYLAIAKKYEPLLLLPIGFGIFIVNFPLVPLMGQSAEGQRLSVADILSLRTAMGGDSLCHLSGIGRHDRFRSADCQSQNAARRCRRAIGRFHHLYRHRAGRLYPQGGGVGGHHRRGRRSDDHLSDPAPGAAAARSECAGGLFLHGHGAADPAGHHEMDDQPRGTQDPNAPAAARLTAGKDTVSPGYGRYYRSAGAVRHAVDGHVHAGQPDEGKRGGGPAHRDGPGRIDEHRDHFSGGFGRRDHDADNFLSWKPLFIFGLGLIDFGVCTVGGIATVKIMNLFLKEKINPLDRFGRRFRRSHGGPGIPGSGYEIR